MFNLQVYVKNTLTYKYFCIFHILFVPELYGLEAFHKGRHFAADLPLPNSEHKHENISIDDRWFTQKLDHFHRTDGRTWQQRYFINNQYYDPISGGPIFLLIGGESAPLPEEITTWAWIDYAKQFGALCFQLEHRYYGKSHPTKDLNTENLQYLTSEQALEDVATFIVAMNKKYIQPSKVKWFVFGCSYPGSLAAWMRLKYPHLVHGAVSSSAPILAKVDFSDHFRVIYESLRNYEGCAAAIKEGTSELDVLLNRTTGQQHINEKFQLCDPIGKSTDNHNDIANLYWTLSGIFAGIVQNSRVGTSVKQANLTINTACSIMTNNMLGPPVDRLAAISSLVLNASNQKCLDYKYDKRINNHRNTSWKDKTPVGFRQWMYQTCTEFGFFATSSYTPQIFGNHLPVSFYTQQCTDIFGPQYNSTFVYQAADRTNTVYGGLDIDVTNVVFVQGSIDPWHPLGITQTVNQKAPAIFIKGTLHCADMFAKSDKDLPQLKAARDQIRKYVGSWIRS